MSTPIRIPLAEAPAAITESAIAVLKAHGFVIARRIGESGALEPLPPARAAEVLSELGRNAAQGLVALDLDWELPVDEPRLDRREEAQQEVA